jgi:hypothetical protein
MFGLFKSPRMRDQQLGELVRSRGLWRGTLLVDSGSSVPLAIAGNRAQPDKTALEAAREVLAQLSHWRPAIERALFDHYQPYAEAVAEGDIEASASVPQIDVASEVWPHVSLTFIAVAPLGAILTTELGYAVAWDEEHVLGVRFQSNTFVELCGSTVPA